jgi:hypothetical protein
VRLERPDPAGFYSPNEPSARVLLAGRVREISESCAFDMFLVAKRCQPELAISFRTRKAWRRTTTAAAVRRAHLLRGTRLLRAHSSLAAGERSCVDDGGHTRGGDEVKPFVRRFFQARKVGIRNRKKRAESTVGWCQWGPRCVVHFILMMPGRGR